MFEKERESGINCVNTKCRLHDSSFEQSCCGKLGSGDPSIESCKCYIPEKTICPVFQDLPCGARQPKNGVNGLSCTSCKMSGK